MSTNVLIQDYNRLRDGELVSIMRSRGLIPPFNEDGRLIRNEVYRILKTQDDETVNMEDRVWVTFRESNIPSAGPYVYASINNKNFQAPYNKKVCIPKYFLTECIDRAVQTTYTQTTQSDGSFATVPHTTPVYPYTLHGPAESNTPVSEGVSYETDGIDDVNNTEFAFAEVTEKRGPGRPRKEES